MILNNYSCSNVQSSLTTSINSRLPLMASQNDIAAILYSSGTTGTSKGVVLTHGNFIASAIMTTSDQDFYGESGNVFVCFLPMFHIFGLGCVLYAQLQRGNKVVVMRRYETEEMMRTIERYKVTHIYAVPPVILSLARQKKVVEKYDVSSLREIGSGAAPVAKDVIDQCAKCFPGAVVYQVYGMTETCGIISSENTRTVSSHYSGSTGLLVPGLEAQIMNLETKKPLPPLQKGEILIRGLSLMQGYFKNEKATMETIDDQGWLHTGDLGYFDNEGRLYVVDRMKEIIKYKGFQVAPAELEELLLAHPEIEDAAVVGFSDVEVGEIPVAYVVRSAISSLTEEKIQLFIAKQVAPFKRLRRVIFVDGIPKSASGKILRKDLRQNFAAKL